MRRKDDSTITVMLTFGEAVRLTWAMLRAFVSIYRRGGNAIRIRAGSGTETGAWDWPPSLGIEQDDEA